MDPNLLTKLKGPPGPDLEEACARCLVADIKGEVTSAAWPALAQQSAMEGELYLKCIMYRLLTKASLSQRPGEPSSLDMMCRNSIARDLRSRTSCQSKILATFQALARNEIDTSALHTDSTIFIRLLCVDAQQYPDAWLDSDPLVRARGIIQILESDGEGFHQSSSQQLNKLKNAILATKVAELDFFSALKLTEFLSSHKLSGELAHWQGAQIISALSSIKDVIALSACAGALALSVAPSSKLLTSILGILGLYEDFEPEFIWALSLLCQLVDSGRAKDFDEVEILLACQALNRTRSLSQLWRWFESTEKQIVLNYLHLTIQDVLITGQGDLREVCSTMRLTLRRVTPEARKCWLSLIAGKQSSTIFHNVIRSILSLMPAEAAADCVHLFKSAPHSYKSILAEFILISPERMAQLKEQPKNCKDALERMTFLQKHLTTGECIELVRAHWHGCQTLIDHVDKVDWGRLESERVAEPSTIQPPQLPPTPSEPSAFLIQLGSTAATTAPLMTNTSFPKNVTAKIQLESDLDDFFREL